MVTIFFFKDAFPMKSIILLIRYKKQQPTAYLPWCPGSSRMPRSQFRSCFTCCQSRITTERGGGPRTGWRVWSGAWESLLLNSQRSCLLWNRPSKTRKILAEKKVLSKHQTQILRFGICAIYWKVFYTVVYMYYIYKLFLLSCI